MLDRELQRTILNYLAGEYPREIDIQELSKDLSGNIHADVSYLAEHSLVEKRIVKRMISTGPTIRDTKQAPVNVVKITASGLDFLADDGGLSSILNVVTIRFEDETLKALLIDRIKEEPGDPTVKDRMIAEVKSLPSNALKSIGEKAISHGIASAPAGLLALSGWLTTLAAG